MEGLTCQPIFSRSIFTWDQTRPIRRGFGAESVTSLAWLEEFAGIVVLLLPLIVDILDISDIFDKMAIANNETISAMTSKSFSEVPVPRYFPIRVGAQLREHMRALRKQAGLTQAQLGHRLGVGQARIAEIENNPAATSVEQFLRVLSTLGAGLVISTVESEPALPKEKPSMERKASRARVPAASRSRKLSGGSYLVSADPKATDMQAQLERLRELNPAAEVSVTSGRNFVIRAKKGTW